MTNFINSEHNVEKLFPVGTTFYFEGKEYKVSLCGKPRPSQGDTVSLSVSDAGH